MRKVLSSLVIALMLSWSSAASADYHLSRGIDAYFAGDVDAAYRVFREPAEQGDAEAQKWLGSLYNKFIKDYCEAAKWWRLSAEQGNASAQSGLAYLYSKGKCVLHDIVTAHMWYNISVASGGAYHNEFIRDSFAKQMTLTQIAEAQKMAREWMEKHQAN